MVLILCKFSDLVLYHENNFDGIEVIERALFFHSKI